MRRAIVIFTRGVGLERKRFGLGRYADTRLGAGLVGRTFATAARCTDAADIIIADEGWQSGTTFEARLLSALRRVQEIGSYERIVLVGTDTPELTTEDLHTALLADEPVVGPSTDGGFYLLGLTISELEQVLRGLPWQTRRVGAALEARLGSFRRLAVRHDIDDAIDTRALLSLLRRLLGPLDNHIEQTPPRDSTPWNTRSGVQDSCGPRGPPVAGR